jgi:L-ascorbate metabolism protein UlaG (beta-lactamase superfamily)
VLITHEHKDHVNEESSKLSATFLCPAATAIQWPFLKDAVKVMAGEQLEHISVVQVECMGAAASVGYIVEDVIKVLHPGDSFYLKGILADVMFVPIFPDYHPQILQSVKECKVEWVFPFHFDPRKEAKLKVAEELVAKISKLGVNARILEIGEWVHADTLF